MTAPRIALVLRALGIAIAAVAWIDPSVAARRDTRVAVIDNGAPAGVRSSVREALSVAFDVTSGRDTSADAWVVVADGEDTDLPAAPAGVALSLVTPVADPRGLRLERLDVPARVGRDARATATAEYVARGLAGTTSRLAVRVGPLELGHIDHRWTRANERFLARFDLVLPAAGPNHLVVDAIEDARSARAARGDAVILVDDRPIPVLVFEGRPSWTTTFVRRALERDTRYAVTSAARVSRGVTTSSTVHPVEAVRSPVQLERLTAQALETFAVVIVGAPETLTASDVQALRVFVDTRGGGLVLAPDRRVSGPVLGLLADASFGEHLLDEPVAIDLVGASGLRLLASELLELKPHQEPQKEGGALAPPVTGIHALGLSPASRPGSSSVLLMPTGNGQVLFVGALDAWRFRGRAGDAFDRWWAQVVEWLARVTPDAVSVSLDRTAVAPGARVAIRARVRGMADGQLTPVGLSASLTAVDDASRREVVRMWPDSAVGMFVATINAPTAPGVYAVSVDGSTAASEGATAHASLVVDADARTARPLDDRWRAVTQARRGVVVTASELDALTASLGALTPRAPVASRWFPMRSVWWIVPLAACLGGEWWLRRRAGLR